MWNYSGYHFSLKTIQFSAEIQNEGDIIFKAFPSFLAGKLVSNTGLWIKPIIMISYAFLINNIYLLLVILKQFYYVYGDYEEV